MARLVFNGATHRLTLYDAQGERVGEWEANNVVDHGATFRFVPNGHHPVIDPTAPHRHGGSADSLNGPYGRFGILRVSPFRAEGHQHTGVGVHSGRANRGGANHATMGCIRTTDDAMRAITTHIRQDPLTGLVVEGNRDQVNLAPHHRPDPHPPQPGNTPHGVGTVHARILDTAN